MLLPLDVWRLLVIVLQLEARGLRWNAALVPIVVGFGEAVDVGGLLDGLDRGERNLSLVSQVVGAFLLHFVCTLDALVALVLG